ncbi:MAG: peptidase S9 [Planctomycetes bacterium]|nr:peptidase S9 [Planctomycetota bacterium]
MSRTSSLMILFALSMVGASLAQSEPMEPWTVDDVVRQEGGGGMAVSPDGRWACWLKTVCDEDKDRYVRRLFLTDLESGKSRQLVFGEAGVSGPRWSPDGKRIGYLTSRKPDGAKESAKGSQVWVLRLDGGEPRAVTKVKGGVRAFQWRNDDELIITARERDTAAERVDEKRKDKSVVFEDEDRFRDQAVRLFRVELGDDGGAGKLRRITKNRDRIGAFEVSPGGQYVVYVRTVSPHSRADGREPPRVFVRDIDAGAEHELFGERRNRPGRFVWQRNARMLFASVPHSTVDGENSASVQHVYAVSPSTGAAKQIALDWERGAGGSLCGLRGGFATLLRDGVTYRAARYTLTMAGWKRELLTGTHAARLFALSASPGSDRVVYVTGAADDPDHWCSATLDGAALKDEHEFHRPNGGWKKRRIARREIVTWKGANGDDVEGILYFPNGYAEGNKYPLIAMPHGGPHGADLDRFSQRYAYLPQFYSQRGAFCLFINYHGSAAYGLAWGESIKGRYYELEVEDILSGIDAQVKAGRVDTDQLGLIGWSNGAILSIACLTHADVYAKSYDFTFKACAPGAGDVNWTSDYGNCAFGARFDDYYLGGPPWAIPDVYLKKSPLFFVNKVTTPTLIFFGDKDTAVPTEQGYQWYRALQQTGKAPVRFVLFPGQPHGLNKPSYRRRKMDEELRWFGQHLFNMTASAPRLDDASPLAHALAAAEYARRGAAYGNEEKGVLVPETVAVGGLQVGRFEVTRAQWGAVFADYTIDDGTENLPIVGVSIQQARDYVKRLSDRTGVKWRLPTTKEHKALPRGPEENTLDWWIGFKPAPEDARHFTAKAASVRSEGGMPPLLATVGTRKPGTRKIGSKTLRFHDVGGNAAEWVVGDDGMPQLVGPTAFTATDDRAARARALPAYAGVRVVRDG